jgi:hypothetical protein
MLGENLMIAFEGCQGKLSGLACGGGGGGGGKRSKETKTAELPSFSISVSAPLAAEAAAMAVL